MLELPALEVLDYFKWESGADFFSLNLESKRTKAMFPDIEELVWYLNNMSEPAPFAQISLIGGEHLERCKISLRSPGD